MRPNPQSGSSHEAEPEVPIPQIAGVAVSAWSIDPKRRRRYLQIAFGVASLIVALIVLYLLRDFLGAFVLGGAIAFLVQPALLRLVALGIPRLLAIPIVFLVLMVLAAGVIVLIVPLGVNSFAQLQAQAPGLAAAAQDRINALQGSPIQILGFTVDLKGMTETISSHLKDYVLGQFGNALTIGLTALSLLLQLVLMLIVAVLLSVDAPAVRKDLRRLVPNDYRADFDQIWRRVRKMLYAYFRGQLIVAALIGVFSGIACAVLGLADPLALGLIAGLTALIPYLGPILGAVPAILVGLAAGPVTALIIAVAYFVISNVILNIVYPKIVGDAVRLPPVLVIVALIAGFSWAGILGMFVAVPIAATLRILFDHIYPRLYERPV